MDSVMAKKKPSRQRLWTKDEVRELRALAKQRLTAAIIARRLKRSLDSTKRKASVLGVPLGAAVRWTKDDLQKLRSLAAKKQPLPTIARALKRTQAAIERWRRMSVFRWICGTRATRECRSGCRLRSGTTWTNGLLHRAIDRPAPKLFAVYWSELSEGHPWASASPKHDPRLRRWQAAKWTS